VTRPRVSVLCLAAAGAVTAALAFLPWYRVDTPAGSLTESGVAATPELWTLPVVGAAAVGLALVLVALPAPLTGARRVATLCIVPAAGLAVAWAVENAVSVPVGLDIAVPGQPAARLAADLLQVDVRPAAYLAAAAAAIAGMAAILRLLEEPPAG
jgi:hypothetical protein